MAYISLGDIMDGISAYDKLFNQFSYTNTGVGGRAWSTRMLGADGSTIEFRGSEWVYEGSRGSHTGRNAKDLQTFLLESLNRDQLIALLVAA